MASIKVKYDCGYLATEGVFFSPTAPSTHPHWVNWTGSAPNGATVDKQNISFKIGDPALLVSGFKFWDTIHYQYSCTKKFDFVTPEIPGVTPEPVFETATESRYFYVTSHEHYEGFLKIL